MSVDTDTRRPERRELAVPKSVAGQTIVAFLLSAFFMVSVIFAMFILM